MTTILTSIQNPKIQRVRRLRAQKKARDEEGKFMIEGVRLVEEALRQNAPLETIIPASLIKKKSFEIHSFRIPFLCDPVYKRTAGVHLQYNCKQDKGNEV